VSDTKYSADLKALQAEMSTLEESRREDIVRFRADIASLAATIRRCVQLGLASAPRSKLLMKLHAALSVECDAQEAVDRVNERIRKTGGRIGALGPRIDMKGEEGMVAVVRIFGEVARLQVEREGREKELERVGGRREGIEVELKGLGGCHCQAGMCRRCMELLRVCEECEEAARAWEKVAAK
jgi:hypothetical protein